MSKSGDVSNWKYNVSKKIAQLTRVIFRLHTESLDRRDLVAHVKKRCDEEIAAVVEHTNGVIEEVQRNSEEYRENLEKIMREEYEQKFEQAKKECEIVKEKIQNDGKQLVETYAIESARNQKEIENLKGQIEKAKRAFEDAADKLAQENKKIVDAMEEKHKKELESAINEGNARYNKLMMDTFKKDEALKLQMQKEMAEAKRNAVSESNVEIDNLKKKVADLEKKIRAMEGAAKKQAITITNLKNNVSSLEEENEALKKKSEESEKALLAQQELELKKASDLSAKEMSEKQRLFEEKIKQSESEKERLAEEIENLKGMFQRKEKEYLWKIAEAERTLAANDGISNQKLQEILAEHKAEVEGLELKFDQFVGDAQRKESLMHEELLNIQKQYLEEIEELKRVHESELRTRESEIPKLKEQHAHQLETITSDYERRIAEMKEKMEAELAADERLRAQVVAESASFKAQIAKMIEDHERQIQEFNDKKAKDIQVIHQNYGVQIEAMRKQYEDKLKERDDSYEQKLKEIEQNAQARVRQLEENEEVNLRLSIEQQKREIEQETAKQMEMMRNQIDKQLENYAIELKKKDAELQRINEAFDRNLAEKNRKIAEMQEKQTAMQNAWDGEKARLLEEHAQKLQLLSEEIAQQKEQYEQQIASMKSEYEQRIEELSKRLESVELQNASEAEKIKEEHAKEKEDLQQEIQTLKAEVDRLVGISGQSVKEMQQRIDDLAKENAEQMEKLKKAHESQYDALNARHKEEQKKLTERADSYIAQAKEYKLMNQKLQDQINDLTSAAEKDIMSRISELERQKLCDLNAQATQYQKRISDLEQLVAELRKQMDVLEQKHQTDLQAKDRDAGDKMGELDRANAERLAEIEGKHIDDLQKKDEAIAQLKQQIEELELRWDSRDSRPEDLERIQKLEDTVRERTDTLTKLFNELKHYQNELLNRETAYNKLFNTRPNIGVYNVIERKVKRDTMVSEATTPTAKNLPPLADAKIAKTLTPRASSVMQKKPTSKTERPSTAIKRPRQIE